MAILVVVDAAPLFKGESLSRTDTVLLVLVLLLLVIQIVLLIHHHTRRHTAREQGAQDK